jgi:hypothetical protein
MLQVLVEIIHGRCIIISILATLNNTKTNANDCLSHACDKDSRTLKSYKTWKYVNAMYKNELWLLTTYGHPVSLLVPIERKTLNPC